VIFLLVAGFCGLGCFLGLFLVLGCFSGFLWCGFASELHLHSY